MNITDLNQFAIDNRVKFTTGKGGWIYAHLENNGATAFVSLYGAHVLHYTPKDGSEVLWNTEKSFFEQGKPIRGGIPVCWPWFGPHATDTTKPMHGFARLSMWEVKKTQITTTGETELVLSLRDNDQTFALWPFHFQANIIIRLGDKLTLSLDITNTGSEQFTFADALHTYLRVGDVSQISIEGLQGATYLDGTNKNNSIVQSEKLIEIKKEENRRYINTSADCIVNDPVLKRKIRIEKQNSNTTVVWNPWIDVAKFMADMDDEGYKTMVCVEAANAFNDTVTLEPNQVFKMSTSIGLL